MAQKEFVSKTSGLISEGEYNFFNWSDYQWIETEKRWKKIDLWRELEKRTAEEARAKLEELKNEANPEWAKKTRLSFLDKEIKRLNSEIKDILRVYKDIRSNKDPIISQAVSNTLLKVRGFEEKEKSLKRYYYEKNGLNGNHRNGNGVTQEMIERARAYPFSELLEVDRNQFAFCPFHKEHTRSFYTRGNYGFCFGACGFSGDIIKFLMKRDEIGFVEAVKRLCNR